jgi:hypothetical protein
MIYYFDEAANDKKKSLLDKINEVRDKHRVNQLMNQEYIIKINKIIM